MTREPAARGRRWQRAALALAATGLALVAAELVLRAAGLPAPRDDFRHLTVGIAEPGSFIADPVTFWRLRPSAHHYQPNRVGLRGAWPDRQAAPGAVRIACVGDSSTFGVGHRYEDTYGMLLERRLQQRLDRRDVEVVLAALPGFTVVQCLALYRARIAALRPDATVIYVGAWNDYAPAVGATDAERAAAQAEFAASTWSGLHLARLMRSAWLGLAAHRVLAATKAAIAEGEEPVLRRVPLAEFKTRLAALLDAVEAHGGSPILVLPPLPASTAARHPISREYRARIAALADARDIPLIDGAAVLAAAECELPPRLRAAVDGLTPAYLDAVHPSPLGHRALAEALAPVVRAALEPLPLAPPPALRPHIAGQPALDPRTGWVTVHGAGFARPGAVREAWFGDVWAREIHIESDTELRLRVPPLLPAGPRRVVLRSPAGPVASAPVDVAVPTLQAQVQPGSPAELVLRIEDCPPCSLRVWFSAKVTEQPRCTPYGRFALLGALPPAPAAPVRWHKLPLPALSDRVATRGLWTMRRPGDLVPHRTVWAQALLVDPDQPHYGLLTPPTKVEVGG